MCFCFRLAFRGHRRAGGSAPRAPPHPLPGAPSPKTHLGSARGSSAQRSGTLALRRTAWRPQEACSWATRLAAMARGYLARGRGASPLCRVESLLWRWQADSPTHSPACFSPKAYGPKRAKRGFRLKASLSRYPLCHCYACTYGLWPGMVTTIQ